MKPEDGIVNLEKKPADPYQQAKVPKETIEEIIQKVERERDEWKARYDHAVRSASTQIAHLEHLLQAATKRLESYYPLRASLEQALNDEVETHMRKP